MPTFTDDVIVNPGNFSAVGVGGWNSSGDYATLKLGDDYNSVRANWSGVFQMIAPWGWQFDEQRPGVNNTRFKINNTGEVGIGTSSPSALLDVRGTAIFGSSAKCRIYDGATWSELGTTTDNPLHVYAFNAKPVVLNAFGGAGFVGVRTSSPQAALHVNASGTNSATMCVLSSNDTSRMTVVWDSLGIGTNLVYIQANGVKLEFVDNRPYSENWMEIDNANQRGVLLLHSNSTSGKPGVLGLASPNGTAYSVWVNNQGQLQVTQGFPYGA